jgi:uncharacterized protein (DUF2267 family)
MTRHHVVERAVDGANVWIHDLETSWGIDDRDRAVAALRAVLHVLRDRLPIEETAHLSAQLPVLIRGLFFEGWQPSHQPARLHREEVLVRIAREAGLLWEDEAQEACRAVAQVLWNHTTEGVMSHVLAVLPVDLVDLFS